MLVNQWQAHNFEQSMKRVTDALALIGELLEAMDKDNSKPDPEKVKQIKQLAYDAALIMTLE